MQSFSTMLMGRIMMKMVAVICCLDWIKLDWLSCSVDTIYNVNSDSLSFNDFVYI